MQQALACFGMRLRAKQNKAESQSAQFHELTRSPPRGGKRVKVYGFQGAFGLSVKLHMPLNALRGHLTCILPHPIKRLYIFFTSMACARECQNPDPSGKRASSRAYILNSLVVPDPGSLSWEYSCDRKYGAARKLHSSYALHVVFKNASGRDRFFSQHGLGQPKRPIRHVPAAGRHGASENILSL